MGKKVKIGKQRKDRFYQLAKETGYRSRSAFKLIQLNRKYEFLQKSRVLVDLCAAPGGWLQVAKENMPVSSLILGVDLVPIRPLQDITTLEQDITTGKCRQEIKKHLKTWKADTILHDGAPNIGKNWLHDAFQQAQLTLSALKLATGCLVKGGWFITKVFRSKDYQALMWVFQQFFKKVYATKPQASRLESAEIFVVCQNYLAPDRIDPKFLDARFVFEEVDPEPKVKLNLMHPEKQKKRVEGYPEGDTTLFHRVPVSKFVTVSSFVELLNDCNELWFDDEKYLNSAHTTLELQECCKDIKVLGRKELRLLLAWRKKLIEEFHPKEKPDESQKEEESEDEETRIQNQIEAAQLEETTEMKRKKKKVQKEKRKLHEKMNLKMVIPDDEPMICEDPMLFKLGTIKNRTQLSEVEETDLKTLDADMADRFNGEVATVGGRKRVAYEKDDRNLDGLYSDEEDSDDESAESLHSAVGESDEEEDEGVEDAAEDGANPLMVDLDNSTDNQKKKRAIDMWFGKDIFSGIEKDEDEKYEMEQIITYFENKGYLKGSSKSNETDVDEPSEDEDDETTENNASQQNNNEANAVPNDDTNQADAKAQSDKNPKKRKQMLDVEGLALGTLMIHSKKQKRDIIDQAWNRYTFDEKNLPDWFVKDEAKHGRKAIPVSKELVDEYKERLKEINARPIKKVAEAKARKKRKTQRKMEKARKKANAVTESLDMSETEKRQHIKAIYKKAMPTENKEVTYVVSKKSLSGKRMRRPAGVKGRFRVVDPRMKKDDHKRKAQDKQTRKGTQGHASKQKNNNSKQNKTHKRPKPKRRK